MQKNPHSSTYLLPIYLAILSLIFASCQNHPNSNQNKILSSTNKEKTPINQVDIKPINKNSIPQYKGIIAITNANIIDVIEKKLIENAYLIIQNNLIQNIGAMDEMSIPDNVKIIDAQGKYLLPGLIDAHFHLDRLKKYPNIFLHHGITSLRDPGAWIEAYEGEINAGYALPRLFLTGPHLDMYPPAYPKNSYIIRDAEEAQAEVKHFIDQGASAIKVYFRLSLGLIKEVCNTAHTYGIPVTAHLEITDAKDAILAGLDGIEHVTSLGTTLIPKQQAEAYRQSMLADNNARRQGRYEIWNSIDINSPKVDELITFLVDQETFLCPTLGAFEYRLEGEKNDTVRHNGFQNMMTFMQKAYHGGVTIVVGSHSSVPYSEPTWAYHHEMELFAEFGMSPMDILVAATIQNAYFFRIEDRLGSLENGKIADLVMVEENPLDDIRALRNVRGVMLNGVWVEE